MSPRLTPLALLLGAALLSSACTVQPDETPKLTPDLPSNGQLKPLGADLGETPYSLGRVKPRGAGLDVLPGVTQPGRAGADNPAGRGGTPTP